MTEIDQGYLEFTIIIEFIYQLQTNPETFLEIEKHQNFTKQSCFENFFSESMHQARQGMSQRNEVYKFYQDQYRRNNINKILNLNLRFLIFDTFIHLDSEFVIEMLQQLNDIYPDGILDKQTLSAVNSSDQINLIKCFLMQIKYSIENMEMSAKKECYERRIEKIEKILAEDVLIKQFQSASRNQFSEKAQLYNIKGINCGLATFLLDNQENIRLSDLASVLSVFYNPQLTDEQRTICFSLDPIILQNSEITQQEKVCWPDKLVNKIVIADTEFASILFESDYLLKLFSLGVDKDGQSKFQYPEELIEKGLKPCFKFAEQNDQQRQKMSRFWLVPDDCKYFKNESVYVIEDISVICQTRQLEQIGNQLVDKINQDPNDYSYKFAQKFTELYDQIAVFYPVFHRLKQLFKAVVLGKWIYCNRIKIDFQQLGQFSRKVNNNPKIIPIVKFEEKFEDKQIPIYFTPEEKLEFAKKYLEENGHPTTQSLIDQVIKQIPDIKGYQIQQSSHCCAGGIDPNCKNTKEKLISSQEMNILTDSLKETEMPFCKSTKCQDCQRWVEKYLTSIDQPNCSIHNQYTCQLCLDVIFSQDPNPQKDPNYCRAEISRLQEIFQENQKGLIKMAQIFSQSHETCKKKFQSKLQNKENEEKEFQSQLQQMFGLEYFLTQSQNSDSRNMTQGKILQQQQQTQYSETSFQDNLKIVFKLEGGYSHKQCDLGGKTNLGVTQGTYDDFCAKTNRQTKGVEKLTREDAEDCYRYLYKQSNCHQFQNKGTRLIIFDIVVNHGGGNVGHLLRISLNTNEKDLSKLIKMTNAASDQKNLQKSLIEARREFYYQIVKRSEEKLKNATEEEKKMKSQKNNLLGWLARLIYIETECSKLE